MKAHLPPNFTIGLYCALSDMWWSVVEQKQRKGHGHYAPWCGSFCPLPFYPCIMPQLLLGNKNKYLNIFVEIRDPLNVPDSSNITHTPLYVVYGTLHFTLEMYHVSKRTKANRRKAAGLSGCQRCGRMNTSLDAYACGVYENALWAFWAFFLTFLSFFSLSSFQRYSAR